MNNGCNRRILHPQTEQNCLVFWPGWGLHLHCECGCEYSEYAVVTRYAQSDSLLLKNANFDRFPLITSQKREISKKFS